MVVYINDRPPKTPEEEQLAFAMGDWLYETEMLYVKSFHPIIQNEQLLIRVESEYDVLYYGESLDLDYIQDKISPLVAAHISPDLDYTQIMISMELVYDDAVNLMSYCLVFDGKEKIDLSDDKEIKKQIIEEILSQATPSLSEFPNSRIDLTIEDSYLCKFLIKWAEIIKPSINGSQ